eukprot:CAMPEP_0116878238 /NCGR_PEP_ID=MMETSP0463-20121206/9967_1 /TAXON_ID=181622 /ORGANISM="Strombidinopsis sp, Strain SopsisLIS2011" /LENGTH=75 /DNA_ID=CAMNT_0004526217 /DNA_START=134 /DNA_END=360 /DNA_ORIENTATION=-
MGVSTSWKWEDANRVIQHDPRVKAFRAMADRKNAFQEYILDLRNKEKNDAAIETIAAKGEFLGIAERVENTHEFK